jgi:hypothetical protein
MYGIVSLVIAKAITLLIFLVKLIFLPKDI